MPVWIRDCFPRTRSDRTSTIPSSIPGPRPTRSRSTTRTRSPANPSRSDMPRPGYDIITREGVDPTTAAGKPPLPPIGQVRFESHGLSVERNAPVRLRDGTAIYLDIYRPRQAATKLPVLLAWGPYGKHHQSSRLWPAAEVEEGWISELTGFEAPDPVYWCGHGYAVAYADPRGLWLSEGTFFHNGPQEAEDVYDTIEWLGAADWCNGRVGMLGVSYLAGIQYIAASTNPPSLKAISPWECFADWYREFAYHGGIPETGFLPRASRNVSYSLYRTEDTYANIKAHPLMHDYYRHKYGELSRITVPAYVVASWSDHGLHSRGTLDAFELMSSEQKWLEVHGQKKWRYFYLPESVARQRAFFDHFLLDQDSGLQSWPRVRMEIRDRPGISHVRGDLPWPVPLTWATRLYLGVGRDCLAVASPEERSGRTFDPRTEQFDAAFTFSEDTTVVGPMRLRLWLAVEHGTDADVFVAVRKFDRAGTEVGFPFNALFDDGPVALGWLRASHRALDEQASTELRPVHMHEREESIVAGKPVPLDIELWPSGTVFHAGERLTVTVLGRDFVSRSVDPASPVIRHEDLRNEGNWTIFSGGEYDSYLSLAQAAPPAPSRTGALPSSPRRG
ncbi:MAG: CocE/NonD family hydrolase [Pseudonocardiaceae bacterium]|nr:CocE/NonD family hydrolase [Pseudonocardiaceae bacterium]